MGPKASEKIKELLAALNADRSSDRSEGQRRLAILITDTEKLLAWALYVEEVAL